MIERYLKVQIQNKLGAGKIIIILGARQTGKTTLLKQITASLPGVLWLNGDELDVQAIFETSSSMRLLHFIGDHTMVILDEAQRIKNIGLSLKLIYDHQPDIQLIATGSSAFELANQINEPLTGRKWEFNLFPLSFSEMVHHHSLLNEKRLLPQRLLYGYYPEVVNAPGNEKQVLRALSDSYLYKDILLWERIQKPEKLLKLLQALAFQVGQQVSYHELALLVGLDAKTVDHYIQLLEKTFIIFRLNSFARNLRNELKFAKKIYFFDLGIRNALISNFAPIEMRPDVGALWENFLITERIKYNQQKQVWCNMYFWRTKDQQEVDYLEEIDGQLYAFEFKWNIKKTSSSKKSFTRQYPQAIVHTITTDNYDAFIHGH